MRSLLVVFDAPRLRNLPLLALLLVPPAVLGLGLLGGCAAGEPPPDLSTRDFSVDLDAGTQDDAGLDQATPSDLGPSCDLGSSIDGGGDPALLLAGIGSTGDLLSAHFSPATGWIADPAAAGAQLDELTLAVLEPGSRAMVLARQQDDTVAAAGWEPCSGGFSPFAAIAADATTLVRPAAIGGTFAELIFRGSVAGDQRYYHARFDGTSWGSITTLGNLLSSLPPTALRAGSEVHSVFTGSDGNLYEGVVNGSGGAATPIAGATSTHGPAAVTRLDGAIVVVFTGNDTNLYFALRPSGGAFSSPAALCTNLPSCLIASDHPPALGLDAAGQAIAAWRGKDDLLYTSTLQAAQWTTPLPASAAETVLHLPAIAPGLGGAEAELIYVRASDSRPRHARLTTGAWQSPASTPLPALRTSPALAVLAP